MRAWLAMGLAALLALWQPGAPLRAQDAPPTPYNYSETLTYSAPIGEARSDDQRAREAAAADAAEAACAAGGMAGCTALGEAFMQGQGRPLNRPVAELVLRRACNAAEARGCYLLAVLLPGSLGKEGLPEALDLAIRACRLGSAEGCELDADNVETGRFADLGPADAMAVRRENCARGLAAVCIDLGERLAGFDGAPEQRAEGRTLLGGLCDKGNDKACLALARALDRYGDGPQDKARAAALLDRLCRAGDARACNNAASIVRDNAGADDPRFTQYQGMGCYAGDEMACLFVAQTAARSGESGREAAIDFFDRACPVFKGACTDAATLREQPVVAATCAAGDQRACVRLGTWMAEKNGPFEDPRQATVLLSAACYAGETAGCLPAGRLLIEADDGTPQAAVVIDANLSRGCSGGEAKACTALARALIDGRVVAQNTPRALALYAEGCDAGDSEACNALANRERQDPAVPLMLASGLAPPTVTQEELLSQQMAAFRAESEALRRSKCTATRVIWEGSEYADEACLNVDYSIGGFTVNRVELAPFQALLWRPAKLGSQTIGYRTACGGAVVATGWIITAAHCTYDLGVKIEDHDYRVRLGVIQPDAPEGNSFPIVKVIRHPDFSPKTYQFDIALVQYDPNRGARGAFAFGARRIAIDKRSTLQRAFRPQAPVFAFGWGRQSLNDPTPAKILQGVKLEVEETTRCTQRTAYRDWRKDSVLCAMGANREQACKGDSGGPLVTYEDRPGVPTLIGVVSSGEQCSTSGVPSRYIRIGHERVQLWLENNLPGFKRGAPAARAR